MSTATTHNNLTALVNWTVQYDSEFMMPEILRGTVAKSPTQMFKPGTSLQLESILYLDLVSKTVLAADKYHTKFKLIGPGSRMVSISEQDFQDLSKPETL